MALKCDETKIQDNVKLAVSKAVEDKVIMACDEVLENLTADCVEAITEWFDSDSNAHDMTETEYMAVILDMSCIYDIMAD